MQSKGLLAGMDVAALKRKVTTEPYAALWSRLNVHWRDIAKRQAAAQAKGEHYSYGALAWHSITPGIIEAGLAYHLAGDTEALAFVEDAIARLAAHWKTLTPNPDGATKGAYVQSHDEVALAADLCREGLSDGAMASLTWLMRDCIIDCNSRRTPLVHNGAGGNVQAAATFNAGVAALVWGEDVDHPSWREVVDLQIEAIRVYLRHSVDDSGQGYEGVGYLHCVSHLMYLSVQLLKQRDVVDLFATEPKLAAIVDGSRSLMMPDRRSLTPIGDHGFLTPWSMNWLLLTARHCNRPADLDFWYEFQGPNHPIRPYGAAGDWYEETTGKDFSECRAYTASHALTFLWWDADAPRTPIADVAPLHTYARGNETVTMRTSWSRDAVYLNVLGSGRSRASLTHAHADAGHFSIFAHGKHLAVDTCRGHGAEDQHNVILVDGVGRWPSTGPGMESANPREGRVTDFQHHDALNYVAVDEAHMKACRWADRQVLFVPVGEDDAYMVVLDNVNPADKECTNWWQLHTMPGNTIAINGDHRARIDADDVELEIAFVQPSAEVYPTCPHELSVEQDIARSKYSSFPAGTPASDLMLITNASRPRLLAKQTGLNCKLMAVLTPQRKDDRRFTVTTSNEDFVVRAAVTHGEFTDHIIWALDHANMLRLPDVEAITTLAFYRTDLAGDVVAKWTVDGAPLNIRK